MGGQKKRVSLAAGETPFKMNQGALLHLISGRVVGCATINNSLGVGVCVESCKQPVF